MKKRTIFCLFALLLFGIFQEKLLGQTELTNKEIGQAKKTADSIKVVEGASLQQGGSFTDPVSSQGLTFSSDLGLTENKQVFGYDALTLNGRWVPGTNDIGSRIFLNLGVANWFTPGFSEIYADSVLNMEERFLQSETKKSWIAGLGIALLRPKKIQDKDYAPVKSIIDQLAADYENAGNDSLLLKKIDQKEENLAWMLYREKSRSARWTVGGNFRLIGLGEFSNIDVFDLYTTFARGKGIYDFSMAGHFIAPRKQSASLRNAFTLSAGVYVDMDDQPPVNTLALIFRYGQYNFREKIIELNGDPNVPPVLVRNQPLVHNFDATLTFSGLRSIGFFGAGLGFRYAVRSNSNFDTETEFAILFTSKFVKERKEKPAEN